MSETAVARTERPGIALAPCPDENCGAEGCPEHPAHIGPEHTYEMHHAATDHEGPGPCRCIDAIEVSRSG